MLLCNFLILRLKNKAYSEFFGGHDKLILTALEEIWKTKAYFRPVIN